MVKVYANQKKNTNYGYDYIESIKPSEPVYIIINGKKYYVIDIYK